MMSNGFKLTIAAAGVALALGGVEASHFRGGVMIPSISAGGLLTVNATTYWRPTGVADIDEGGAIALSGSQSGSLTQVGAQVNDTSDTRFTRVTSVHQVQLTGPGTFNLAASSCCRVSGISNFAGGSSTTWTLNSQIVWDGSSATTPVSFNIQSIQPEVVRGGTYTGNLGAVGGPGLTLSYDQALNPVIASQPPGFTINTSTGALNIPAASTTVANYPDNPSGNIGADVSFSGNIFARNAAGQQVAQVEFEWLFDGVAQGSTNLAPVGNDAIINALLGSTVNHTFTATDDGNPNPPGSLTWLFLSFLGGGAVNAPTFNPATQQFTWDSTGSPAGQYVAQVQVSDSALTDIVLLTINVGQQPPPPGKIPEPGTLSLLGLALAGLGFGIRRKTRRS
ncbi:MAG TPA: PEP-CTERM sorting domain-containing protein [Casimicrobiaceae bacterium]|nr:PEP-CTERM sorting domain-containing protein [Casimicrobiaceae bacterium]